MSHGTINVTVILGELVRRSSHGQTLIACPWTTAVRLCTTVMASRLLSISSTLLWLAAIRTVAAEGLHIDLFWNPSRLVGQLYFETTSTFEHSIQLPKWAPFIEKVGMIDGFNERFPDKTKFGYYLLTKRGWTPLDSPDAASHKPNRMTVAVLRDIGKPASLCTNC
eukprot:GHVU01149466.1.p1 GENE.GHVU01149466.1~~GHVU01149466.1.p1  ORF type:complete len:166 (+),score=6.76 GHVU01149466.1:677-1174(+)